MNRIEEIISLLGLEPHPFESGYYRRTYESAHYVEGMGEGNSNRSLCTSIFYLLTKDRPINVLHRNKSDIIHFFHLGGAIQYTTVTDEGEIVHQVLGSKLNQGQHLQLLVSGGVWKAAELLEGEYGLISEVVIPGFEYADNEIATIDHLQGFTGAIREKLRLLIK
ncbi:cupin domain-containing protein [Endozoicomonas sp. SM1973]|uniref:Cupin domain-containing protein n=1 Tax=Spartinivicinus marinus TaxID=2994442 RepID=A0A853IF57_9GAMM|nr:cupin domain-containing protein [Spartinivicinus marinus]MCX4025932.1 cupin domain-containing protein [Spartinivicinus marinus]NYZ68117.1 cupin domain-containing protein [Spartinivicinus marinus]